LILNKIEFTGNLAVEWFGDEKIKGARELVKCKKLEVNYRKIKNKIQKRE